MGALSNINMLKKNHSVNGFIIQEELNQEMVKMPLDWLLAQPGQMDTPKLRKLILSDIVVIQF